MARDQVSSYLQSPGYRAAVDAAAAHGSDKVRPDNINAPRTSPVTIAADQARATGSPLTAAALEAIDQPANRLVPLFSESATDAGISQSPEPNGINILEYGKPVEQKAVEPVVVAPEPSQVVLPEPPAVVAPVDNVAVQDTRTVSQKLNQLIAEHGFDAGWVDSPELLDVNPMGGINDKISLTAKFLRDAEIKKAKERASEYFGLNVDDLRFNKGKLALAEKINQHVGFFDAVQPAEGKVEVAVGDMVIGDKLKVNTEDVFVTNVDPEGNVTLKDGSKFGTQTVRDGQVLYVDKPEAPTLKQGQKFGDLFVNQSDPLRLVGEKGTDFAKASADQAATDKAAADAKTAADAQAAADAAAGEASPEAKAAADAKAKADADAAAAAAAPAPAAAAVAAAAQGRAEGLAAAG